MANPFQSERHFALNSSFRFLRLNDDTGLLVCAVGRRIIRGSIYVRLLGELESSKNLTQIRASLNGTVGGPETIYALRSLVDHGYVVERQSCDWEFTNDILWDALKVDPGLARSRLAESSVRFITLSSRPSVLLQTGLSTAGLNLQENGAVALIEVDHYLDERLADLNDTFLTTGTPWLILKSGGLIPWIGPFFVPKVTACWKCLAERLHRNHSWLEPFISSDRVLDSFTSCGSLPQAEMTVASLAVTEILRSVGGNGAVGLRNQLVEVDLLAASMRKHSVVRRPQCAACGSYPSANREPVFWRESEPNSAKQLDSFRSDVFDVSEAIAHQISPLTGLIPSVDRIDLPYPEVIHVFSAGVTSLNSEACPGDLDRGRFVYASGKGTTESRARLSAIGEALERYAVAFQGYETTRFCSLADLEGAAIHPNEYMRFSAQQLIRRDQGRKSCTPTILPADEKIHWTPLVSLHSGKQVWLPTSLCYFRAPYKNEERYSVFDSNGVAAGACVAEAAVNGILEVIERDAVGIWWYNMPALPGVVMEDSDDEYIRRLIKAYTELGFTLVSYEITNDLDVPVFASSAVDARENGLHSLQFGFGCAFDRANALKRSLTELNQKLPTLLRQKSGALAFDARPPSFLTHFVRSGTETSSWNDDPGSIQCALRTLLDAVSAKGMEVFLLGLTRPDVELAVARAVIPGMRHIRPRFAPGRMYEVAPQLGWRLRPVLEAYLNPIDLKA
jgi:oxazoline/thiazoline synthase